jgi:carboxyl-terminal processing protease
MQRNRNAKKYILTVVLVGVIILGQSLLFSRDDKKKSAARDDWRQELKKFSRIYSLIKHVYPETIDKEKLFYSSINGLLKRLDPHSYFLDPLMVRSLNEDQQGNYYGIGTRITKYEDRLTVVAPLKDAPASKLGIMAGDVIAEIEGKDTRTMSLDDAMKMLRGAKGTYVSIKIRREGMSELIPFKIKRAEIPLNSISYSVAHPEAPEIAYISLRTFGNTTAKEFSDNMKELAKSHPIKALILDLRGNAGGSLYAAIDLADFFLKKGAVIVSVKGRTFNQNFKAKKDNQYEQLPVAVLINRGSASASEIVAAALQDHKRGTILGSRSWGKGLVQTISRLSLNSSLALTTAKYYTPANKCLQRDFDERDDYFFFVNNRNYDTDQSIEGGVIPDIPIKQEFYPEVIVTCISKGLFFKFARFLITGGLKISKTFKADDEIIKKFRTYVKEQEVKLDEKELVKHVARFRIEIEREALSQVFSPDEGIKVFLKADTVSQKAVEVLKLKYN